MGRNAMRTPSLWEIFQASCHRLFFVPAVYKTYLERLLVRKTRQLRVAGVHHHHQQRHCRQRRRARNGKEAGRRSGRDDELQLDEASRRGDGEELRQVTESVRGGRAGASARTAAGHRHVADPLALPPGHRRLDSPPLCR